jgi:hypothetical protein
MNPQSFVSIGNGFHNQLPKVADKENVASQNLASLDRGFNQKALLNNESNHPKVKLS